MNSTHYAALLALTLVLALAVARLAGSTIKNALTHVSNSVTYKPPSGDLDGRK